METINALRAECVRYYVEKGYTLDHCEVYVPKDEAEIRRIYECIQEEKKWKTNISNSNVRNCIWKYIQWRTKH